MQEAALQYRCTDDERVPHVNTATDSGFLACGPLVPGTYVFGAKTAEGKFGYRADVNVGAGEAIADLKVAVSSSGTLRVRYAGPDEEATGWILVHGLNIAEERLTRGAPLDIAVPADERLTVSIRGENREITVAAGETVEIDLGQPR